MISKSKDSFDVIQCDSPVQLVEFILSHIVYYRRRKR